MVLIPKVTGDYKPINITGGPHIVPCNSPGILTQSPESPLTTLPPPPSRAPWPAPRDRWRVHVAFWRHNEAWRADAADRR